MPAASSFGGSVRSVPPVPVKAAGRAADSHSGVMYRGTVPSSSPTFTAQRSYRIPFTSQGLSSVARSVQRTESGILGSMSRMIQPLRPPSQTQPRSVIGVAPGGGMRYSKASGYDSLPAPVGTVTREGFGPITRQPIPPAYKGLTIAKQRAMQRTLGLKGIRGVVPADPAYTRRFLA